MRLAIACAAVLAVSSAARGHDKWGNGEPVEPWVKKLCCGPEDVHKIPRTAITIGPDGYHIEGLVTVIPFSRVQPSPDGAYWGFWRNELEPDPPIFCFFAPANGS